MVKRWTLVQQERLLVELEINLQKLIVYAKTKELFNFFTK